MFQVTGFIETHGNMYLGWVQNFKGIAAQGHSHDEVLQKLLLLIRVKIAFDHKLPLVNVSASEVAAGKKHKIEWKNKNEFQLQF
jgi:predicted RNase H-like HicB family nuclease